MTSPNFDYFQTEKTIEVLRESQMKILELAWMESMVRQSESA